MTQQPKQFVLPSFKQNLNLASRKQFQDFHRNVKGTKLFERYHPGVEFINKSEEDELWLEKRQLMSAPLTQATVVDPQGKTHQGLNFASNNYLGLANHPFTIKAGIEAATEFGVNSAGSPLAFGATKYFAQLREQIGEFYDASCLVFSSGWLACFGFIKAIVKDYDNILIDEQCDGALFEGSHFTTRSVHTFKHLDAEDLRIKLEKLRKTKDNGIMVITDSLFNHDSESPDLVKYQKITAQNQAYLLINTGHDFGVFGESGKGIWEEQQMNEVNNVFFVGSGSKTLGVNFAFMALPGSKKNFIHFWKYFCSTYMFTNAINPVQSNCGLATLRMMRSQLGKQLREKVLSNAEFLREKLSNKGYKVLGRVSPFICVDVGNEVFARMITKALMQNGIFVNVVEYPHTKEGHGTIRMSLNPQHTEDQLSRLVEGFEWAHGACKKVFDKEVPIFKNRCPNAKL